jgi:hypothetical protein
MDDENTITITSTGVIDSIEPIVINLNDTYGATTSYATGIMAQEISSIDSTMSYTIDLNDTITLNNLNTVTIGAVGSSGSVFTSGAGASHEWWVASPSTHIEIAEIEKMCSEYPALAKVYENFKTVYDLVKQDWKGKQDADKNS